MDKVQSYAVTFRPRDGITDAQVDRLSKWIRKASKYYHIVTEKTMGSRHLHAGLILNASATRSNVVQRVVQLFPEMPPDEKRVFRQGIKIMYNEDFIRSYLDKGDDTVVIATCLPEKGHLESYFPEKKNKPPKVQKICSPYYWELEKYWYEYNGPEKEVTTQACRDLLFMLMYDLRLIPVLKDSATIKNHAQNLARFICKVNVADAIELAPFEKEEYYGLPSTK